MLRLLACCAVALFVPTGTSLAATPGCVGPPGTSAIEEYCEQLPAGGGSGSAGASHAAPAPPAVPGHTARVLERSPAGRALLSAGEATVRARRSARSGTTAGTSGATRSAAQGLPQVPGAGSAVGAGSTLDLGFLLPLGAASLALVALAFVLRRRQP